MNKSQINTNIDALINSLVIRGVTAKDIRDAVSPIIQDSYNQLDEPRTALTTPYDTSNINWTVPHTEIQTSLDELAQRIRTIENLPIITTNVYVSTNGNDATAQLGNEQRPFATFAAALAASPSSYIVLTVAPGTYNETLTFNKPYSKLILQNVVLNWGLAISGDYVIVEGNNSIIDNLGSNPIAYYYTSCYPTGAAITINNLYIKYSQNNFVNGNDGLAACLGTALFNNCIFENSRTITTGALGVSYIGSGSMFNNCIFIKTGNVGTGSACVYRTLGVFNNCAFYNLNGVISFQSAGTTLSTFKNCYFYGAIGMESGDAMGNFDSCIFENGLSDYCVVDSGNSRYPNATFKNCFFNSTKNCIVKSGNHNAQDTLSGQMLLLNCDLKCDPAYNVFVESTPAILTTPPALKRTYVINCRLSKAYTPVTVNEQRLFMYNTQVISDMQSPTINFF